MIVAASGCGGEKKAGEPATQRLAVSATAPPEAHACGFDRLASGESKTRGSGRSPAPPRPGVYSYATTGREAKPGGQAGTRPLPRVSRATASPVRTSGQLRC